jgi:hypothetical protein
MIPMYLAAILVRFPDSAAWASASRDSTTDST